MKSGSPISCLRFILSSSRSIGVCSSIPRNIFASHQAHSYQQVREMHSNQKGDVTPSRPNRNVIDLTDDSPPPSHRVESDSEDEDLKAAIALSLQTMPKSDVVTKTTKAPSPVAYGIPGIDRRQQEEERLARLKRKRDGTISPPATRKAAKPSVITQSAPTTATTAVTASPVSLATSRSGSVSSSISSSGKAKTKSPALQESLSYADGTVKKTWAFGQPRLNDIKIEEIIQRSTLEAAVFSSFQWDMEWLFNKLDTSRTKFVFVMQAKEQFVQEQYRRETASIPNLRLCFPPMEGQVNCMHSKLMLLFHPTYLRIAVPTANLVPYDWGESGGFMENMVFVIDLPRLETGATAESTTFKDQLVWFLKAQTLQQDVLDKVELFNFSKTKGYEFVHTIGGAHYEPNLKKTGISGLAQAVKRLGQETSKPIELDYITSSVGSLKKEFLKSVYLAAKGDDSFLNPPNRGTKSSKTNASSSRTQDSESDWEQHFRFYFPSNNTVEASKAGPRGAGTICFQENWWNNPSFPRELMKDCVSSRPGMLMHNKIMYIRPVKIPASSMSAEKGGWAYVGSANLSESAWGKVVHDRATKALKLNCRNWECGVLVPFHRIENHTSSNTEVAESLLAVDSIVPVPIQVPARELGAVKPWFFMAR